MPRGKNYVNNHKGVFLSAPKGKKVAKMTECQYGAGCTRPDCIYSHSKGQGEFQQSQEPCMPFLAGVCSFTSTGCRKRHPPQAEAERLIAKYKSTRCRFSDKCRTEGCLYIHPGDEKERPPQAVNAALFPPLGTSRAAPPLGNSAWKMTPVLPQQYRTPGNSGGNLYPLENNLNRVVETPMSHSYAYTTREGQPSAHGSGSTTCGSGSTNRKEEELNVHAKEFVPGKW
jgi:RNA-binding, Nab2-type zinc finger